MDRVEKLLIFFGALLLIVALVCLGYVSRAPQHIYIFDSRGDLLFEDIGNGVYCDSRGCRWANKGSRIYYSIPNGGRAELVFVKNDKE